MSTATSQVTIGLVQINNSFSGQNYLPLSTALLEGYVKNNAPNPDRYKFLTHIYKRVAIYSAVNDLLGSDIVGFSTYVWNSKISLEIAKRLKQQEPDVLVVFGGPHVPDDPEEFLRDNRQVDLVVHNEGEITFLDIIERYPSRDWRGIAGTSFLEGENYYHAMGRMRLKDLEAIPSPFLSGSFEQVVQKNPEEKWIGLWETNRGCPFKCTFCDWGSATAAKVNKFEMNRLKGEVQWFADHQIEYIFCCDANFGILPRDVDIAKYVADIKKERGYPHALSVQNTKNATERAYMTQKILSDAGLNKGVVLSMQSVDAETLKSISRDNISLESYFELQKRFTSDGVETYSDLILGLPGETYESFTLGVDLLIKSGQHNRIQFNNLSILPNAEMGNKDYQKQYGMEIVESKIINIHGERVELEDDVDEYQDLVVSTLAMPREEWCRTRAFCWMVALMYFDKLLQIPLMLTHNLTGVSYKDMVEKFMDASQDHPVIASIGLFFAKEAQNIQNGGTEYVFSKDWLGIYWPADEYIFIQLTVDGQIQNFFEESLSILNSMVEEDWHADVIREAVNLNLALVKQPWKEDLSMECHYNILDYYYEFRQGNTIELKKNRHVVQIDCSSEYYDNLDDWYREVVWWGNKKGAYLYGNESVGKQYAGHY